MRHKCKHQSKAASPVNQYISKMDSLYNMFESTASARFSLGDGSVRCVVCEWMSVVAKHLDFDACITAAVEALLR